MKVLFILWASVISFGEKYTINYYFFDEQTDELIMTRDVLETRGPKELRKFHKLQTNLKV